jgi:hypothetical protein
MDEEKFLSSKNEEEGEIVGNWEKREWLKAREG